MSNLLYVADCENVFYARCQNTLLAKAQYVVNPGAANRYTQREKNDFYEDGGVHNWWFPWWQEQYSSLPTEVALGLVTGQTPEENPRKSTH